MLAQVGTYTGDGVDNRAITGVGFEPSLVVIKGDTTQQAVFRTASITGDNSFTFNGALTTNIIQSLDTDGFTVGTDATVNSNDITYYYITIRRETNDPDFNYGTYTGDGTDDRNITGIGFQPTLVVVKRSGSSAIYFDNNDDDIIGSHLIAAGTLTNRIQALQSDGFQIGSNTNINSNGVTYYWFAFRGATRRITTGTYTGNATDNRDITGLGFSPNWLWISNWVAGTSVSDEVVFRTSSMSGDASLGFAQLRAITANLIQALQSDGFQIGTHNNVNINNEAYHWFALAVTSTSTSTSTSSTTSTSSSTTSTSSSTTTSTSTTTTLTSTSTSTTSTSTSTTSTSTSTTSTSTSTTTSTSTSTSTSTTSTSTTTTMPLLPFAVDSGEDSSAEGGSFSVDEGTKE